ncbi:MAG: translational GTPase TypA [Planctomycetota bacterium]
MMRIKNIAVIAHVDHGKTTLIDGMIRQGGILRENQDMGACIMDSNALERERGITILAKNISIVYKDTKINIIDTPGHADFGGEVERVLSMASGVLLVVDAYEGPMPQTRYVLKKALGYHLKAILVVNKTDRPDARPEKTPDEVFDLFCRLEATDKQLDFPVVYASGRDQTATYDLATPGKNLVPLFETILKTIPDANGDESLPFRMQVSNIEYNDFVGRIAIGRIHEGTLRKRAKIGCFTPGGAHEPGEVTNLYLFEGLKRRETDSAGAGDIVAVAGFPEIKIGDTLAEGETPEPLALVAIDEPTLSMIFRVNDSPFVGTEGTLVTSRNIRERLDRELRSNVALRIEPTDEPDAYKVSGRGVLSLSILIENMRREGFEVLVSNPVPVYHDVDGARHEPVELMTVDVSDEAASKIIELTGQRKGRMEHMEKRGDRTHMEFIIPSRGLLGLRNRVLSAARGEATMYHVHSHYEPYKGSILQRGAGVLVATETGTATTYAIEDLQERGKLFIAPGDRIYEGMIVGEHCKDDDINVNICRKRRMTNIRAASADRTVPLDAPVRFSLEEALEYIRGDELVEVTPKSVRMRKRFLKELERRRNTKRDA